MSVIQSKCMFVRGRNQGIWSFLHSDFAIIVSYRTIDNSINAIVVKKRLLFSN